MYKISQYLKAKYAQILQYFTKYYYVKYYCEKLGAFTERLAVGKPRQSRKHAGIMLYNDAHRGGLRSYRLANVCRVQPISTAQYKHYLKFINP
jgi:hypothetical protein